MTASELSLFDLLADAPTASPLPKSKAKRTAKAPIPASITPTYGLISTPSFTRGIKADASTRVEDLPLPAIGVEAVGSNVDRRLQANRDAEAMALKLTQERRRPDETEEALLYSHSGGGGIGESTDAYFTPTRLALAAWTIARKLDPSARTALEPSCGTGAFLATAPSGMRLTAIEYDEHSARIAGLLHKDVHVHHAAFETYHSTSPDSRVDFVIGNPPFGVRGDTRHIDARHAGTRRAEEYFIRASLERLKPGGLLLMVVPEALLSNERHDNFREWLLTEAAVLGGFAIPIAAFKAAGAGVTCALLVLRKHDQGVADVLREVDDSTRKALYGLHAEAFRQGTLALRNGQVNWPHFSTAGAKVGHGQYGQPLLGGDLIVTQDRVDTMISVLRDRMNDAISTARLESEILSRLGREVHARAQERIRISEHHAIPEGTRSLCKTFTFKRGRWRYSTLLATPEAQTALALARELRREQLTGQPSAKRTELTVALRATTGEDAHAQVRRLEQIARTYPIVNLVLNPPQIPTPKRFTVLPGSLEDTAAQLADTWQLTTDRLMQEAGVSHAEAGQHLLEHYRFDGVRWVHPLEYDFGHAYLKAESARTLAVNQKPDSYEREALLAQADRFEARAFMQAKSLTQTRLAPRDELIPEDALQAWVNAYLQTDDGGEARLLVVREKGLVRLIPRAGHSADRYVLENGPTRKLEQYLNHDTPLDRIEREGLQPEEVEARRAAAMKRAMNYERSIEAHFRQWLTDSEHAPAIEDRYNRTRNAYLHAPEDTRTLNLPGWRGPKHHLFQRGDIRTLAAWGHGLLNYAVGVGKTFTTLGLLSRLKQRGEAQMPWIVTPLSLCGNWVVNAALARPDWNVLVIGMEPTGTFDEDGLPEFKPDSTPQRKAKLASLLSEKPDLVVISLEAFTDVPMLEETRLDLIHSDAAILAQAAQSEGFDVQTKGFRGRKALVKEEEFCEALLSRVRSAHENELPFELFGVDTLVFEEAHKLKNLFEAPDHLGDKPKFMGAGLASNRAYDAYQKARYVRSQHGGRGTYSLTATAWKNSPLEVFYALLLVTDDLSSFCLNTPAAFMLQYCDVQPTLVTRPDGTVGMRPAVIGFKNTKELRGLMAAHVIIRDAETCRLDDRVGLPLPPLQRMIHTLELTPEQEEAYQMYRREAQSPDREGENHLFAIFNRMQQVNLDPQRHVGGENPRALKAAELALDAEVRGQKSIAFLDRGGDGREGSTFQAYVNAYVAAGIPRDAIEVITASTHANTPLRMAAEKRFRRGETRHILGSSVIREGFNLQHWTRHLIHLDLPSDPEDIKQRDGRGWRQGNPNPEIFSHFLLARGSYDALQYTNVMGKQGWLGHLASGEDSGTNPAAFDAAATALLLAADPEQAAETIRKQELAMQAEALRLELHRRWGLVRDFLQSAQLLRTRYVTALGRKHGPTAHDEQNFKRLEGDLGKAARALVELPEEFLHALRFAPPITWEENVPLSAGVQIKVEGTLHVVQEVTTSEVITKEGRLEREQVSLASEIRLPEAEKLYGRDPLASLPLGVAERIQALLDAPREEVEVAPEQTPEPEVTPQEAAPEVQPPVAPSSPAIKVGHRNLMLAQAPGTGRLYLPQGRALHAVPAGERPNAPVLLEVTDEAVWMISTGAMYQQLQTLLAQHPLVLQQRVEGLLQHVS